MIDQILSALRISLAECNKYKEPAEYIYQINQVLNRYKTNLFKMIPNKENLAYDPKELFNIQIRGNWRCRPDFSRRTVIIDSSPLMLHIVGFMPEIGRRLNLEKNLSKSIQIDDVIDLELINQLKTDYYSEASKTTSNDYEGEDKIIENSLGWKKAMQCSMYWKVDRAVDEVCVFSFQLNGQVYEEALDEHHFTSASSMKVKGETPRQQAFQDALERKLLSKGNNGAHYAEIHDEPKKEDPVGDFFSPVPNSVRDKVSDLTLALAKPKKTNAGIPRKKHSFW